jgi:hypothetical protein
MKIPKVALVAIGFMLMPSLASATWPERGYNHQSPFSTSEHRRLEGNWGHSSGNYNNHNYYPNYSPDYRRPGFGWSGNGNDAIQRGIQSGRLSRDEARELERDQYQLQAKQRAYLADGIVTKREREDLDDARHDFYKDLNHELNDGERRW